MHDIHPDKHTDFRFNLYVNTLDTDCRVLIIFSTSYPDFAISFMTHLSCDEDEMIMIMMMMTMVTSAVPEPCFGSLMMMDTVRDG